MDAIEAIILILVAVLVPLGMLTYHHGLWPWTGMAAAAPAGPYGAGSHAPLADNSMPAGFTIKGNVDSMLYHRPDSRAYQATIAEVWFDSAERAEAAGFGLAGSHPTT